MKTRFYKSSKFYYFLFVGIAVLQLTASILAIIFNVSNTTRDNAISNIFLCLLAIALMSAPRYMKTKFNITFKNWIEILVLFFLFMSIILGFVQEFYITVQGFRSEERRVGKSVDLGVRRIIRKKKERY